MLVVRSWKLAVASHDLHALSTPPAFILDQDQILCRSRYDICFFAHRLRQAADSAGDVGTAGKLQTFYWFTKLPEPIGIRPTHNLCTGFVTGFPTLRRDCYHKFSSYFPYRTSALCTLETTLRLRSGLFFGLPKNNKNTHRNPEPVEGLLRMFLYQIVNCEVRDLFSRPRLFSQGVPIVYPAKTSVKPCKPRP